MTLYLECNTDLEYDFMEKFTCTKTQRCFTTHCLTLIPNVKKTPSILETLISQMFVYKLIIFIYLLLKKIRIIFPRI